MVFYFCSNKNHKGMNIFSIIKSLLAVLKLRPYQILGLYVM